MTLFQSKVNIDIIVAAKNRKSRKQSAEIYSRL